MTFGTCMRILKHISASSKVAEYLGTVLGLCLYKTERTSSRTHEKTSHENLFLVEEGSFRKLNRSGRTSVVERERIGIV